MRPDKKKESVAVRLILKINRFFKPWQDYSLLRQNPNPQGKMAYSYHNAQFQIDFFLTGFPELMENKKNILDLGCGYGGLALVLAERLNQQVKAMDTDWQGLLANKNFQKKRAAPGGRVYLVRADADHPPFRSNSFDLIYSFATMEHFVDPQQVLKECRRMVAESGKIFFRFSPFYAYNGAHLFDFIHIPWCHLFFRQKTLIRAWKRLAADHPDMARFNTTVDLIQERLIGINRMSIRRFKKILKRSGLRVVVCKAHTFNRWYCRLLSKLPVLREILTTEIVSVLTK